MIYMLYKIQIIQLCSLKSRLYKNVNKFIFWGKKNWKKNEANGMKKTKITPQKDKLRGVKSSQARATHNDTSHYIEYFLKKWESQLFICTRCSRFAPFQPRYKQSHLIQVRIHLPASHRSRFSTAFPLIQWFQLKFVRGFLNSIIETRFYRWNIRSWSYRTSGKSSRATRVKTGKEKVRPMIKKQGKRPQTVTYFFAKKGGLRCTPRTRT